MKKTILLSVLILSTTTFAATIGTWGTADYTIGSWSSASSWQSGAVPVPTASTSDEIKVQRQGSDATIDGVSGASYDYIQRLSIGSNDAAGATAPAIVRIQESDSQNPTVFGMGEFRVGAAQGSDKGGWGEVYQTGGTLSVSDLFLSRNKAQTGGTTGRGLYVISGGTLQVRSGASASAGRIFVGSYAETSGPAGVGKLVIDGDDATINMNHLYVGSNTRTENTTGAGDGTLEFKLTAAGKVSKITVVDTRLDQVADSLTKLLVTVTSAPTDEVILLIENTGANAVLGTFDTINGIAAAEGATVNLAGSNYTLTYLYDAVSGTVGAGNDIALIIPEPVTFAFIGLGYLIIRRK